MKNRRALALSLTLGAGLLLSACQDVRLVPDRCGCGCVAAPLIDPCKPLNLGGAPAAGSTDAATPDATGTSPEAAGGPQAPR